MKPLNKTEWVEETLESLDGIQRAEAPADLFEKAMQRSKRSKARIIQMPPVYVWSAAACALLLVVANVFICLNFSHGRSMSNAPKEAFAKEYFAFSDTPQI